ncbi:MULTISPECIES: YafY family protein [Ciceribacter]|uniref:Putative DNA-binding transcriptional regulator YafY n=1 Tax=Ciceribacter lividus TaxID=1197950 RepID=A0A6I7HJ32_9HYPH|nr:MULTISPECIES: YafY family protein [Ciceribacter]MCO6180032.1 YafY family transcriptional regulator [Ciceribacter sp. RN22]RCW22037.1 putative DNA-binding transcriptional regulator YafY [Ciceribacter lividus]
MSRSERLLQLLQVLRQHRRPVSGRVLAETLGISLRTLYRDIASLQAQGADIDGEAGVGYMLRPGYMLPPLMFSADEIEALVLGMRLVASRADPQLVFAARDALSKIDAVLPADLRETLASSPLLAGGKPELPEDRVDLTLLRKAIQAERTLRIVYRDEKGSATERTIWPFALAFFDGARVLLAWCTLRNDFRHFRTDRMDVIEEGTGRYPRRRTQLLKEWRQKSGIPERIF